MRDIVKGAEIKTKKQQVCRKGEFLVAEIDAKIGGIGIVPENLDGAIVSSHYFLFEINESLINKQFLNFFIRTPIFCDQIAAQGSTNYAAIRPSDVLGYSIPLPPLEEQRRIVGRVEELVGKIGEVRSLRQKALEETMLIYKSAVASLIQPNTNKSHIPHPKLSQR
ncbi:restriction endonuclease subunit S [Anabaena sp. FACHB-1237]|uniref:restriction endonuclease subunit S n=1 Tax=Anabaena sp. FACHB-1237 TaxID=2692769 RepID=UPI0018EFF6C0|nr:restriction endonuclease subunit S [Anabaena sp. FACHB-1237]